jgi:hypothetical protein
MKNEISACFEKQFTRCGYSNYVVPPACMYRLFVMFDKQFPVWEGYSDKVVGVYENLTEAVLHLTELHTRWFDSFQSAGVISYEQFVNSVNAVQPVEKVFASIKGGVRVGDEFYDLKTWAGRVRHARWMTSDRYTPFFGLSYPLQCRVVISHGLENEYILYNMADGSEGERYRALESACSRLAEMHQTWFQRNQRKVGSANVN